MGPGSAGWIACGAALGLVAASAPPAVAAPAEPTEESTLAVDYQADGDCPARERFLALVQAALEIPGEPAAAAARAPDARVRVAIHAAGAAYRGTMEKLDDGTSSAPRVVAGARCEEVAQALALTVAFSLSAAVAAAPPAAAVAAPLLPGIAAIALAPVVSARVAAAVAVGSARGRAPAPPWYWQAGLGAGAGGWLAPDTLAGIDGGATLRSPSEIGPLALGWGVRARAGYARNDWRGDHPAARFGLLAGGLDLCGYGRPARGPVELGLCAGAEVGWLRGRGEQVATPRTSDWTWLALGGGPLVRLPLAGRWQIEARGVVERPLRQVRFSFDQPALAVAQTRSVVGIGVLALIARLP